MLQVRAALPGGRPDDAGRRQPVQHASEHAAAGRSMRVSNDTLRSAFLAALDDAQRRVVETQHQVSTGLRINSPSDDPVAAARVAHLDASLARLDQYQANATFARNQLGLEEEIADRGDRPLCSAFASSTLQANNATLERRRPARRSRREIRQHRDALLGAREHDRRRRPAICSPAIARRRQPFTIAAGGSVVYNGDQGQRTLQISDSRFVAVNDSGADVFQRIPKATARSCSRANAANTGSGTLGASSVVNPAAWVRRHLHDHVSDADDLRGAQQRRCADRLPARSRRRSRLTFAGIELRIDGAPAAGDTFTVAPSAQRDVFTTLDRADHSDRRARRHSRGTRATAQQRRPALGGSRQALAHVIERARRDRRARARARSTGIAERRISRCT